MDRHPHPEELLEFPCDYLFKAFGANDPDGAFQQAVRAAVESVTPVPLDAVKLSRSTAGTYLCVTVMVRLHNFQQLEAIYTSLRRVEGLKYLL
jgi:putative lipoic acid-binding regulatory protein